MGKIIAVLIAVVMLVGCSTETVAVSKDYEAHLKDHLLMFNYIWLTHAEDNPADPDFIDKTVKYHENAKAIREGLEELVPPNKYREDHETIVKMFKALEDMIYYQIKYSTDNSPEIRQKLDQSLDDIVLNMKKAAKTIDKIANH